MNLPSYRPIESLEERVCLSVSVRLSEVPISAAAIAADPQLANFRSFDVLANFTAGDAFNVAGIHARLWEGQFYRPRGNVHTVSSPEDWIDNPNWEFATFVALPGFNTPPLGTLPHETNTPIFTTTVFHPVWGR